jgi:hypothetical protein
LSSEHVYGAKRRRLIRSLRGRVVLAAAALLGALWLAFAGRVEGGDDPALGDGSSQQSPEPSGGGTSTTEAPATTTETETTTTGTETSETETTPAETETTTAEEEPSASTTEES